MPQGELTASLATAADVGVAVRDDTGAACAIPAERPMRKTENAIFVIIMISKSVVRVGANLACGVVN